MELSSKELMCREEVLKQFENYVQDATKTLNDFVGKIGWSLDETPKNNVLVKCPYKNEHKMLPSKLEVHCQNCILKQNGYDSTHSLYPSYKCSTSSQTIQIDETAQTNILKSAHEESNFTLNIKNEPRQVSQSIERYVCDFTPDERRVLYDNAVMNTKLSSNYDLAKKELMGLDIFNKTNEKPKTELEILQEQRDLKRRRAAYRGKRVHTDRKSYIEVLREVVEGLTNSVSHQEDKSEYVETMSNVTETVSNNRVIYKCEGNRNYVDNPYTRWLDIETEESELLKNYEKQNYDSYQEASTSTYSNDKIDVEKSRSRSRSKEKWRSSSRSKSKRSKRSRSRSRFKETKYMTSKRSRSPLKYKETKYYSRHKTRSKSKETMSRKSRSHSTSVESKHKKSKRHRTRSSSSSRKKLKRSNSPIINNSSNEKDNLKSKSSGDHKKKKKHKKKRKHSNSPKRSHKSKKYSDNELDEHFSDKR